MTLKGTRPNASLGVWVDDGAKNTSIVELDPAFDVGNVRPMFVASENGYYRPISSFATVAAAAAGFGGLILGAQNAHTPAKKQMLYHYGQAEVYLNVATSVVIGDKLKPWIDPDTSAVSQTVFELTDVVDDPLAILTIATDVVCPDYPKDLCATGAAPTDSTATAVKAEATVMKVSARWCVGALGCA